jgi:hypothetical protein
MRIGSAASRVGAAVLLASGVLLSTANALPGIDRGGQQVAIEVKFLELDATRALGDFGAKLDGFADHVEKLGMGPGFGIGASAGVTFQPPASSLLPKEAIASIEIGGLFQDFTKGKRGAEDSRQDGELLILQVTPRIAFSAGTGTSILLDLSPAFTHVVTDANAPGGDRHRSTFNGFGVSIGAGVNVMLMPLLGMPQSDLRPFVFLGARVGPSFGHVKERATYGVSGGDNRTVWLYNIYGGAGLQVSPNVTLSLGIDWLKLTNAADATINTSGGSSGRDIEAVIASIRANLHY